MPSVRLPLQACLAAVVLVWPVWATPPSASAQNSRPLGLSPGLKERADALAGLLDKLPHQAVRVSAAVMSLPDGRMIYRRNDTRVLVPASNQKIITAAVALSALGVAYRFETQLALQGGNLVLIGGGDPGLGDPRLAEDSGRSRLHVFERWADLLAGRGLTTIAGDLIIDDSALESTHFHPSWEEADLTHWYAAPVGGLNFNDNCIEVTVWPTAKGQPVRYQVFPGTDWVRIANRCLTGAKNKPWIHRPSSEPLYQLRGQCNRRAELQSVAVPDPGIFAGEVLKSVLRARGIEITGSVRRRVVKSTSQNELEVIASHATPMADVLGRAMRDSQNLFAECLFKSAGRRPSGREEALKPGSWAAGGQFAAQTLQSWGIDTSGMIASDGSGLSRDNRASAAQLVQVLRRMYLDTKVGHLFIESMSLNATDGTLRKRMKDIPARVRAKTGYLKGIRSLSGYVMAGEDRWYAFSVIFNNIPGGTAPYNRIHDNICRALIEPRLVR